MSGFINTIDLLGDDIVFKTFLERTITEFNDDTLTSVGAYSFMGCAELISVDLPNVTTIGGCAFMNCTALKALILRSNTPCWLMSSNGLTNTQIQQGTGHIYVPSGLVDSYKNSGWSAFLDQIRPLEDYTVDGTVTGEIDQTKI